MGTPKEHLNKAKGWLDEGHKVEPGVRNNYSELAYGECQKAIEAMADPGEQLLAHADEIKKTKRAKKNIPDLIAEIESSDK